MSEKRIGTLIYDPAMGRYDIRFGIESYYGGLHCGDCFDVKVKVGDQVKAGDLLAEFDMDLIKSEGYPVTTAVVITNTDDCEAIGEVKTGAVTKDTDVLTVL